MSDQDRRRVPQSGGNTGFAGYEYQIEATVWLALELMLARSVTEKIVIEPPSQEDVEATVQDPADAALGLALEDSTSRLAFQIKSRSSAPLVGLRLLKDHRERPNRRRGDAGTQEPVGDARSRPGNAVCLDNQRDDIAAVAPVRSRGCLGHFRREHAPPRSSDEDERSRTGGVVGTQDLDSWNDHVGDSGVADQAIAVEPRSRGRGRPRCVCGGASRGRPRTRARTGGGDLDTGPTCGGNRGQRRLGGAEASVGPLRATALLFADRENSEQTQRCRNRGSLRHGQDVDRGNLGSTDEAR